ncbi:DUF5681 domain-containing protein [Methylobacterium sp. Gmos1]
MVAKPWTFSKGQSVNPKGRPKGDHHKTTVPMEALLAREAEGLARRAIELAQYGNTISV